MTMVEERWGGYDAGWRAGIPGPLAKRHGKLRRKVAPVGRREGGRRREKGWEKGKDGKMVAASWAEGELGREG